LTPASHLDVERLLTPEERSRLAELEETVVVGASAALLAGRALTEGTHLSSFAGRSKHG
jgi:hypothetical protein